MRLLDTMFHLAVVCTLTDPNEVSEEEYLYRMELLEFVANRLQKGGIKGSLPEITARWLPFYSDAIFEYWCAN